MRISDWSSDVCSSDLLAIVAVVAYQVFGRYVLNDTPTWAESLALVLVLYVTMLGAAVGVRDAGHIGLESVLAMLLPQRQDRKSVVEGKSVSVRVDLGGRRIIKKKKKQRTKSKS